MVQYLVGLVIGGIIGYFVCSFIVVGRSARLNRTDH